MVGVWMRLHDVADTYSELRRSCCSLDAADDARRVAGQLGIPFHVLNLEAAFGRGVLEPFLRAYQAGETPSPCVDCNSTVKFGALLGQARHLYDCAAVATGHYARVATTVDPVTGSTRYRLLAGLDPDKDQSYFLYGLGQAQLAHTRFPLGELTKPQVRAIAREYGLVTAAKPESQEICFVPRRRLPHGPARPGRLVARARAAGRCGRPDRRPAPRRRRVHGRPAPGPWRRPGRAALRGPHRRGDATSCSWAGARTCSAAPSPSATRRSWAARRQIRPVSPPRSASATAPRRCRAASAAVWPPTPPRPPCGTSRWSSPSGRPPRARRRSSTPPGRSSAAGASPTADA